MSSLRSVPPLTLTEQVAEEIRALMARRRMTGRQLAAVLGLPASGLSYRLNGKIPFRVDELEQIADVLGVHPVMLLGGRVDGPPPPSPATDRYWANTKASRNRPAPTLVHTNTTPAVRVAA